MESISGDGSMPAMTTGTQAASPWHNVIGSPSYNKGRPPLYCGLELEATVVLPCRYAVYSSSDSLSIQDSLIA